MRKLIPVLLAVVCAEACSCETSQLDLTGELTCVECTLADDGGAVLDFGVVQVGGTGQRELRLANRGSSALSAAIPPLDPAFSASPVKLTLAPGEEATVVFTYAPADEAEDVSVATIGSDGGALGLHLRGRGTRVRVVCEPDELSFGAVVVETGRDLAVTCRNENADLPAALELGLEGEDGFAIGASTGANVPPGATLEVPLSFAPPRVGSFTARLLVDDAQGTRQDAVTLAGRGIDSGLRIEPAPGEDGCHDVGFVAPGGTVTLALEAVNEGNVPVHVSQLFLEPAAGPFGLDTAAPLLVRGAPPEGPATRVPLPVTFTPEAHGPFTATLHVISDDRVNGVIELCLKGHGGGPVLQCVPESLAFGVTDVATPRTRGVHCVNAGTDVPGAASDLVIEGIHLDAPFTAVLRADSSQTYPAGASFAVDVSFAPPAEQVHAQELEIRTSGGTARIPVTGAGIALEPCTFELRPGDGLDFGTVNRDRRRDLRQIFVNRGGTQCLVTDVSLTGTQAHYYAVGEEWDAPRLVEPGESVPIPVAFLGGVPGSYDASLTMVVNGAGTVTVPLRATVLDLCFELTVTDVDFGTVEPGCSSPERYLQILNSCQTPITITHIDIPQVETADFRLLEAPPLPFAVPGGAVTEVLVAYRPLADGPDVAELRVYASELPGPIMGVLRGNGGPVDRQTDVFEGVGRASADILWVIDNSGSMGDDLQAVAQNAAPFIDVAVEKDIDFRMAVTSTDMESGGLRGRIYPLDQKRPRILTSRMLREDLEKDWAYLIDQGATGSGWESGLAAARAALSPPLITSADLEDTPEPADGNAGFLRRDANLAIVIVSDDRDHSFLPPPGNASREPDEDPEYWKDFLSFFRNIKGESRSDSMLRVHLIGNPVEKCPGSWAPGYGYLEIVEATHGASESICSGDWSQTLEAIAEEAFTFDRCFALHGLPGPAPGETSTDPEEWLEVTMDGDPYGKLSRGGNVRWTYHPETNEICFTPYYAPRPSDTVTVTYTVACNAP